MKPGETWKLIPPMDCKVDTFSLELLEYKGQDKWLTKVYPGKGSNVGAYINGNHSGEWIYKNCRRIA